MRKFIRSETIKMKKIIYKCPLARKRQRCVHSKEKHGEVKTFSEEEIFLYKVKKYARSFNF